MTTTFEQNVALIEQYLQANALQQAQELLQFLCDSPLRNETLSDNQQALLWILLAKFYCANDNIEQMYVVLQNAEKYTPTPELFYLKGKYFEKTGQHKQAFCCYKKAFYLQNEDQRKHNPDYQYSYIRLMQKCAESLTEMVEVVSNYDRFILSYPNIPEAYHQRSEQLKNLGLYDLALRDAEKSLALKPDFALAWCNKAFILNILGHYKEGWQAYEWRWKVDIDTFKQPDWNLTRWQGENIGQAKLLIYAEQGLGDNIQFVRYAILAKQKGLNIVVVNHLPVEKLINTNLARYGITTSNNGQTINGLSYYLPMMSLPYYFATELDTIPCTTAYLQAEDDATARWQQKLPATNILKIGIVWAGSAGHERNRFRSLALSQLMPLFKLNAQFHCLQKEINQQDLELALKIDNLYLWNKHLDSFSDTAGLVSQLDLIISVDTAVAHLAGAMGKPTWILLTYHPDFRWLIDREDSPWYQSVRLFRQRMDLQWDSVIEQVYQQLSAKIQESNYA
ncbi:glycosyltransferase family 9 protein [Lonepinella sp. BR2882]|uniref:glycosyltransferase family 9 protein n=1 Tax=Lonepinella sp. BR2882 TaxID=3095283 RepID=UPI003F6DC730